MPISADGALAAPAFPYKTQPFELQRYALRRSVRAPVYALACEPGTGKTKLTLDTAGLHFLDGRVDALVVLAPNGVHDKWVESEVPKHLTDAAPRAALAWDSGDAHTKAFAAHFRDFAAGRLVAGRHLKVFAMNIDAVLTPLGARALRTVLEHHRCLFAVDESADIAQPGAKRTRRILALGRLAPFRRILDGTPLTESPFNAYSQYGFLDPRILGYPRYEAFKTKYGEWEERENLDGHRYRVLRRHPLTGRPMYRNLEVLVKKLEPHTVRIRLRDMQPDLPPLLPQTRPFALSAEQRAVYRDMLHHYVAEVGGKWATATQRLRIVQDLRLQQIASGYVPVDPPAREAGAWDDPLAWEEATGGPQPVERIPGPNPRLELFLKDLAEFGDRPVLVMTRFKFDIHELLLPALRAAGVRAAAYDGTVKEGDRARALRAFQEERTLQVLVMNPQAGGRGLDITAAEGLTFYTNYVRLRIRLQAERRVERIGLDHPVLMRDYVARGTVDERILRRLLEKREVADYLHNDPAAPAEWLALDSPEHDRP